MTANRVILRWDPYVEPNEEDMQFRLIYSGCLYGTGNDTKVRQRALHVHDIRRNFHKQLDKLWRDHPVLANSQFNKSGVIGESPIYSFDREGYNFIPLVNDRNGLICALDILMLRDGRPGGTLTDVDNRLKTIFDALRMPKDAQELGAGSDRGKQNPASDENPFYVVLEDDKYITHLSVTTDTLLDPVLAVPAENAVRLIINVTIRPYNTQIKTVSFF